MAALPANAQVVGICLWLMFFAVTGLAQISSNLLSMPDDRKVGVRASAHKDTLIFNDGREVTGTFTNENITLRTPYARVALHSRVIAQMDLTGADGGLQRVSTLNSNLLSGIIEDESFGFMPDMGERLEVRRERTAKVIFGTPAGFTNVVGPGVWIELRNGDRLSGRLTADDLKMAEGSKEVDVRTPDIVQLTRPERASVAVLLKDGRRITGKLASEEIPMVLDFGLQLSLQAESIASISERPACSTNSAQPTDVEGLVWIPPGIFLMGSPVEELGRDQDEGPPTKVAIARGFWMGKCEVTQSAYQRLMGINPSHATDDPLQPVERVNWFEAMEYCDKLTQSAEAAGQLPKGYAYRLPSEAEWEYACRAGSGSRFCYGEDRNGTQLEDYAWFARNSDSTTHRVGTRRPNAWGLYDLHGNVWEWCLDRWEGVLPGATMTNRAVVAKGNLRTARGGSWLYEAKSCRSANRDDYAPGNRCSDVGFRVVLAPLEP